MNQDFYEQVIRPQLLEARMRLLDESLETHLEQYGHHGELKLDPPGWTCPECASYVTSVDLPLEVPESW